MTKEEEKIINALTVTKKEYVEYIQTLHKTLDLLNEIQRQTIKINNIKKRIAIEKIGYPPSSDYYRAIMTVLQIIDDEVMKK